VYKFSFTKQAARSLLKALREVAALIRTKLQQLAQDPFGSHPNVTKLQNREGYRLRVDNWCVIYDIQKKEFVILVLKIAPRGEIYK